MKTQILALFLFTTHCSLFFDDETSSESTFSWPMGSAQAFIFQSGDEKPRESSAWLSKNEQGYHVNLKRPGVLDTTKEVTKIIIIFQNGKRFLLQNLTWTSKEPPQLHFSGEVKVTLAIKP